MSEGGGARLTNSKPCTTNEKDKEDDRGDESGTERAVNTWGMYF